MRQRRSSRLTEERNGRWNYSSNHFGLAIGCAPNYSTSGTSMQLAEKKKGMRRAKLDRWGKARTQVRFEGLCRLTGTSAPGIFFKSSGFDLVKLDPNLRSARNQSWARRCCCLSHRKECHNITIDQLSSIV